MSLSYAEVVRIPKTAKKGTNLVNTNLQNHEDESNDGWEMIDVNIDEELESTDLINKNPYCQQLVGVNATDIPPNNIKEAIIGLPVVNTFWEDCWVTRKTSVKGELLCKHIKHL